MSDIELKYRTDLTIPVPPTATDEGRAEWAQRTAEQFVTAVPASSGATERIERALRDLSARADDDAALALLVSEDASVLAPFVVFTSEPMTDAEAAAFLSTETALLPPTGQSSLTQHLGEGFSSTLLENSQGVAYATRRWVFFGRTSTVSASLGPVVPAQAIILVEPIAEVMLDATSAPGFEPIDDPSRIARLMAATERGGDRWES